MEKLAKIARNLVNFIVGILFLLDEKLEGIVKAVFNRFNIPVKTAPVAHAIEILLVADLLPAGITLAVLTAAIILGCGVWVWNRVKPVFRAFMKAFPVARAAYQVALKNYHHLPEKGIRR